LNGGTISTIVEGSDMEHSDPVWAVNFKILKAKLSDGSTIEGKVNIGSYPRLSDFFRHTNDNFICVAVEPDNPNAKKVILANKSFVVWAESED
jgi:hypothetical protein